MEKWKTPGEMEESLSFVRIWSIVVWEFEVTPVDLLIKFINALVFKICKYSRMGTVEEFGLKLKSPSKMALLPLLFSSCNF